VISGNTILYRNLSCFLVIAGQRWGRRVPPMLLSQRRPW